MRRLEKLPATNPDPIGLPDAWFGIFDSVIAFDHVKHRLLFVTHAGEGEEEKRRAFERLRGLEARATAQGAPPRPGAAAPLYLQRNSSSSFLSFLRVEKAKEHIRAGDVFQVVLSRRWSAPFEGDPFAVYRALRSISPSPYQYFLRTPHGTIFGASPERLVRVAASPGAPPSRRSRSPGRARAAPRARRTSRSRRTSSRTQGTGGARHARGPRTQRPRARVRPGSVRVKDFFAVERYSHVMHIASRVVGTLAEGRHAVDALSATFPAGTLTGAPKIRAMEIIEDLEPVRRGAYGGAVGYLDFAGNLDVAIAIRTAVVANGVLHVQAGAGIVADSVAESEAWSARTRRGPSCGPSRGREEFPLILVVDNYDSFTFNLVQILATLDPDVVVVRNDACTVDEILARRPDRIVVSPGPGRPEDAGVSCALIGRDRDIPLLGVCLGHQALGAVFGGRVSRAPTLMHGKTSEIAHDGRGLFEASRTRSRRRATTRSRWRRVRSRTRCASRRRPPTGS